MEEIISVKLFELGYNRFVITDNIDTNAQNFVNANPNVSLEEAKKILENIENEIEEQIVITNDDLETQKTGETPQNPTAADTVAQNGATHLNKNQNISFDAGEIHATITGQSDEAEYRYSFSSGNKVLTIYAKDCSVDVSKLSDSDTIVRLEGSNVAFNSLTQIKAINCYADNSVITGSNEKDVINNMGNNTKIFTGGGDDIVANFGDNAQIYGGKDENVLFNYGKNVFMEGGVDDDFLINKEGGENSTLSGSLGNDRITNYASNTTINAYDDTDEVINKFGANDVTIYKNEDTKITDDGTSSVSNRDIFGLIFGKGSNHQGAMISSDILENLEKMKDIIINIDESGNPHFSAIGKYIFQIGANITNTDVNADLDTQVLQFEAGMRYIAENAENGIITEDIIGKIALGDYLNGPYANLGLNFSSNEMNYMLSRDNMADYAEKAISLYHWLAGYMQYYKLSTLSDSEKEHLKQVLFSIEYLSYFEDEDGWPVALDSVEMILRDTYNYDSNLTGDIDMMIAAYGTDNPDEYIKSHMIKSGTNTTELFSSTNAGEVGEIGGKLYVNDGTQMVELNIDADTYLKLFPPMQRYIVMQGDGMNDCFFLASGAISMIENGKSFAKILQMFSQNNNGDVTITIPGFSDYPITFANGVPKNIDNQYYNGSRVNSEGMGVNACDGIKMLEQAYAIARFGYTHQQDITSLDVDQAIDYIYNGNGTLDDEQTPGGLEFEVYDLLLNNPYNTTGRIEFTNNQEDDYKLLDSWAEQLKAGNIMISTAIFDEVLIDRLESMYNLDPQAEDYTDKLSYYYYRLLEICEDLYYQLPSNHSYIVDSIDVANQMVYVKNPWWSYEVMSFSYEDFILLFYGGAVAEV